MGHVEVNLDAVLRTIPAGELRTTKDIAAAIIARINETGHFVPKTSDVLSCLMKLAPRTPEAVKATTPFKSYGRAVYPWTWGRRNETPPSNHKLPWYVGTAWETPMAFLIGCGSQMLEASPAEVHDMLYQAIALAQKAKEEAPKDTWE
jgi:hypothetical protein